MRSRIFVFLLITLLAGMTPAQTDKPWVQWSKKDIEKILNSSAWGQTQTETDTTEMFYSPTKQGTGSVGQPQASRGTTTEQQGINNNRADRGATNQSISVNYYIRFLSAKPIRQAIVRNVLLSQEKPIEGLEEQLIPFIDRDVSQFIVVAVTFDSTDGRFSGPALQAFGSYTIDTLKNKTYLERKDGKRLFLMEYRAPVNDNMGAKFVFPRMVDGKPFLDINSGNVRFYCELTGEIKLNVKFKISDMMYGGKLEY